MAPRSGLRTGFTTGACAAAAAKAAAIAFLEGQVLSEVEIGLPSGRRVTFPLFACLNDRSSGLATVVKDAGDDPDVTNGAHITVVIRDGGAPGITLERGEGVGFVTKPGLGLEIGAPAINPVPRSMIAAAVGEVLVSQGQPLRVEISVADGERLAQKTLNPRLGILGGLSILGTTGIVVPYSTSAYRVCITQGLDVAVAAGCHSMALSTGARSERLAQQVLGWPEEAFVQMGDYAGYSLRACARRPLQTVTISGMVGKLSKIAAGQLQTHTSESPVEMAFLSRLAAEAGAPPSVVTVTTAANTARHFLEITQAASLSHIPERICQLVCQQMRLVLRSGQRAECLMAGYDGELLARASLG